MADDDLLSADEIEALLNTAGLAPPAAPSPSHRPAATAYAAPQPPGAAERLLERADADLRAAVSPILNPARGRSDSGRPSPFDFPSMPASRPDGPGAIGYDAIEDVELNLRVELGRTELLIEEVLKLRDGSVVPLDKLAGDPVDILVNGRLIARGEVLVLNDNFCVRVAEILSPED